MFRRLKWTVRSTSKRPAIKISDGTYTVDQLKYLEWQNKRRVTLGHQELALDRVVDVLECEMVDYGIMNDMSSILRSDDSYKVAKSVDVAVDLDIQDLREFLSKEKGMYLPEEDAEAENDGAVQIFVLTQPPYRRALSWPAVKVNLITSDDSNIPVDSNDASHDMPGDAGDADDATVSRQEGSEASDD
ncbi:hypothetical protein VTG60DRAFT_7278 [Thermothelomyces hinnuleus]